MKWFYQIVMVLQYKNVIDLGSMSENSCNCTNSKGSLKLFRDPWLNEEIIFDASVKFALFQIDYYVLR